MIGEYRPRSAVFRKFQRLVINSLTNIIYHGYLDANNVVRQHSLSILGTYVSEHAVDTNIRCMEKGKLLVTSNSLFAIEFAKVICKFKESHLRQAMSL